MQFWALKGNLCGVSITNVVPLIVFAEYPVGNGLLSIKAAADGEQFLWLGPAARLKPPTPSILVISVEAGAIHNLRVVLDARTEGLCLHKCAFSRNEGTGSLSPLGSDEVHEPWLAW
jgi:hypothetical protein